MRDSYRMKSILKRLLIKVPVLGPYIQRISTSLKQMKRINEQLETKISDLQGRLKAKASNTLSKLDTQSEKSSNKHKLDDDNFERNSIITDRFIDADTIEMIMRDHSKNIDIGDISSMLTWPEIVDAHEMRHGMEELIRVLNIFYKYNDPNSAHTNVSGAWYLLARKNINQLWNYGYHRFRRTVAHNYFTFEIQSDDPQIKDLECLHTERECAALLALAAQLPNDDDFDMQDQTHFRYHLLLLYSYAKRFDKDNLLSQVNENPEGSPVSIVVDDKVITQDLVNSIIEYYSIWDWVTPSSNGKILEIGGGYGRNAHIIKSVHSGMKYFMMDIPPAIYLAQRFVSSIFRDEKIFRVTDFDDFEEVRDRIEAANIIFLLPHQIAMFPDNYFDLTINISSFGEMTEKQIGFYFSQIGRITEGYFYTKQWKKSINPFDELLLTQDDYPIESSWEVCYSRECEANTAFFEALYKIKGIS